MCDIPVPRNAHCTCGELYVHTFKVQFDQSVRTTQGLTGKSPSLYRRLGAAGEAAVHLLSRMLNFEPARRCSAEEALQHEYFADLELGWQGHRALKCLKDRA